MSCHCFPTTSMGWRGCARWVGSCSGEIQWDVLYNCSMPMPILATKLYIPQPRPKVVLRPQLIERLNEGLAPGPQADPRLRCRRLWQNYAGQRMGRRLQATGRVAVAGRRGQRPHPLSGLSHRGVADACREQRRRACRENWCGNAGDAPVPPAPANRGDADGPAQRNCRLPGSFPPRP